MQLLFIYQPRRQQTFSVKSQIVNILALNCNQCSLSQPFNSTMVAQKQPKHYVNEWVWLWSKELYLQIQEVGQIWPKNHNFPTPSSVYQATGMMEQPEQSVTMTGKANQPNRAPPCHSLLPFHPGGHARNQPPPPWLRVGLAGQLPSAPPPGKTRPQ